MVGYEIDFLPVGDGERSGDAIALRYGENGAYTIHVVDGGDLDAGERLATHVSNYYGAPNHIDHVICTHGDDDHSSGLRVVIDRFEIGSIWMNRPWLYADEILHLFDDNRLTVTSLERRLREAYPILAEIEDMAIARQIPVREVFQETQIGAFIVLSPSRQRYLELIPQFSRTPDAAQDTSRGLGLAGVFAEAARRVGEWIKETWGVETLEEDVETSPSNETSVVQLADFDTNKVLLTGDAGIESLREAADFAELFVASLPGLRFMQIPHHGSRHNVSPAMLNRWIGNLVFEGQTRNTWAYVSVAKQDEDRPRRKVVNAYLRRGAGVYATKGQTIYHYRNMPERKDWVPLTSYEFFDNVEA